jgi:hypothetical protein
MADRHLEAELEQKQAAISHEAETRHRREEDHYQEILQNFETARSPAFSTQDRIDALEAGWSMLTRAERGDLERHGFDFDDEYQRIKNPPDEEARPRKRRRKGGRSRR